MMQIKSTSLLNLVLLTICINIDLLVGNIIPVILTYFYDYPDLYRYD